MRRGMENGRLAQIWKGVNGFPYPYTKEAGALRKIVYLVELMVPHEERTSGKTIVMKS